jgi:hypothetical protein
MLNDSGPYQPASGPGNRHGILKSQIMIKFKYYFLVAVTILLSTATYGQERPRPDSLKTKTDTTVQKNREMPVAKPDEKQPSAPIPQKKVKDNEDGMPVKTFPDSTMKQPKR